VMRTRSGTRLADGRSARARAVVTRKLIARADRKTNASRQVNSSRVGNEPHSPEKIRSEAAHCAPARIRARVPGDHSRVDVARKVTALITRQARDGLELCVFDHPLAGTRDRRRASGT
jgi:hypothetical protein